MEQKKLALNFGVVLLFTLIFVSSAIAYDFSVSVASQNLAVCACSRAENDITITNIGSSYTVFNIIQEGAVSGFSKLATSSVMLIPGESRTIKSQLTIPCDFKGNKELITRISVLDDEKSFSQVISSSADAICSNFKAELGTPKEDLCNGAGYWFYVKIQNLAQTAGIYSFVVQEPEWAFFVNQSLILLPQQTGFAYGRITVPTDEFGQERMVVKIIPANGASPKELAHDFIAAPCFYPALTLEEKNFSMCYEPDMSINLEVLNEGTMDDSYGLSVSPVDIELPKNIINLPAGEKTAVKLKVYAADKDYQVPFKVTLQSLTNPNIKDEISAVVKINSVSTCKKPELKFEKIVNDNFTSKSYSLKLINTGIADAEYLISSSGPSWVALSPEKAVLGPGESAEIVLLALPTEEEAAGKYAESINIKISGTDYSYNYNVPILLTEQKPFVINWWIVVIIIGIIFLALIIWAIILYIRAPKGLRDVEPELFYSGKRRGKHPFKYLLFILIMLMIISLISISFLKLKPAPLTQDSCTELESLCYANETYVQPQEAAPAGNEMTDYIPVSPIEEPADTTPPKEMDPFLYHQFEENTRYTLDLTKYIKDMDNSGLTFTGIPSDHIDVLVEDGIATFIPTANWTGTESISFVVKNNKGFVKETPPMMITVEKAPPKVQKPVLQILKEHLEVNKVRLLVFFVVLILIITFFVVMTGIREKKIIVSSKNSKKRKR